jgi:hypothetical protein
MSENHLRYIVRDIEYKIMQHCPQAVTRTSYYPFEDVEALIDVYAPAAQVEALNEMTGDWTYNVLLNDGHNIVVLVYDLAEMPRVYSNPVVGAGFHGLMA